MAIRPDFGGASGSLTPEQEAAVDSIVNLSEGQIPVASTDGLTDSVASQEADDTISAPASIRAGVNTFALDLAYSIKTGGRQVIFRDEGIPENRHPAFQKINTERHPATVRAREGNRLDNDNPYEIPINTIDNGVIINPEYTLPVPPILNEEGQTATEADVIFDATSVITNVTTDIIINGTLYARYSGDVNVGAYTFVFDPEFDFLVGDILTFKIYSPDGDVVLRGDPTLIPPGSVTGLPVITQKALIWNDKRILHLEDAIPSYRNPSSTAIERQINNAEVIAADSDTGAFTLTVDVNKVDWFEVFDYAGRWNNGSRRVTVSLSNGDNYFLTRRNRRYLWYKDELGNWEWFYQPNFRG